MIGNKYTEIIKEILAEAKHSLIKVGDSVDRIIAVGLDGLLAFGSLDALQNVGVEGKYELSIKLETDYDKEEYYHITVSRIVNNCAVHINDEMLYGTSGGNQTIINACEWAFKEINKFENAPWFTDEELLAEADFIMNVLDSK